jgi:hypothetical protein
MGTNSGNFDLFGDGAEGETGPVPSVDAADLKSVWAMQNEMQARMPGKQFSIGAESYKRACGAGADVRSLFTRVSQLHVLQMLGMLAPWTYGEVVDDAVFKVAATFPMTRMQPGIVYDELPFDLQEFLSQVAKQVEG